MLGQEGKSLGPWEEVVLQDWQAVGLAVLNTCCMLFLSESTALGKQAELQGGGRGGGVVDC